MGLCRLSCPYYIWTIAMVGFVYCRPFLSHCIMWDVTLDLLLKVVILMSILFDINKFICAVFCVLSCRLCTNAMVGFVYGRPLNSGGTKGGIRGHFPPQLEALPPFAPLPIRRGNGKNQLFLAVFFIFALLDMHFAPSMSPHKKYSGAATAGQVIVWRPM